MEVSADLRHQRSQGRPPPRQVAVAGMNANASEKACNGVLRSGLRLTATRVPWAEVERDAIEAASTFGRLRTRRPR